PRFGDNLRRAGRAPSRGVLRLETVQAGSDAAAQLAIPAGSPLVILETVGLADGQPVSVGENRFPADRLPGIAEALECSFADPDTASITRALERCGVASYARSATRVRATLPDAAVARHLMIPPGTPVLETVALDEAEIGPVNLATAWFAGTRVSLVVDTPRLTSPDGGHAAVPQD
ncbi:MAG: UTRA domain-containing protein, partial [Pseudomonadota bacterium]